MFARMRKLFSYDFLPSILCSFILVKMDYALISGWPANHSVDNRIKLVVFFVHLVMLFAISSPLISWLLSRAGDEKLNNFIDLPDSGKKITYTDLYDFLSGLALSAFYLSVLIFTMAEVYDAVGWVLSAIYVFLMFVLSIFIAVLSLVKFLWLFSRFNKITYSVVGLIASVMCMVVIGVAMRMAS